MIFDLILMIMIIVALTRSRTKGCTEDLNFVIAFFIIVRLSGALYHPASKIFLMITDSESLAICAGYVAVAIVLYLIYNAIASNRIIEFGKKVPKTTGIVMTYVFAGIKTIMIFSIIFGLIYSHPAIKKAKDNKSAAVPEDPKKHEKWIAPVSYGLTYAFLGEGTGYLFQNFANYLTETVKTPVEFMTKQKEKQLQGAKTGFDAVKSHEGLGDFVTDDKAKPAPKKAPEPEKKEGQTDAGAGK
ncbi:MAG TPA: hypothetical protein PLK90_07390 [Clostridiales bacterium]|nr:hypothetical protein [Clostridiales bacterium]HQP70209.1 hypothetical protein [Clostridiales bacterium]